MRPRRTLFYRDREVDLDDVDPDEEEAFRWFRLSADQGNATVQCSLGLMYERGIGVDQDHEARPPRVLIPEDHEEALRWFHMSADQGNAHAQCILGRKYEWGIGVDQDHEKAFRWFRLSADQGNPYAECNLGLMYEHGIGVDQDHEEAVRWFRLSADQGNATAQCNLGVMYEHGRGVLQDDKEAVRWFRLSADQGNGYAECNLGLMYEHGRGVPQDDKEAVRLFHRSFASPGVGDEASFHLGRMYKDGRVDQDDRVDRSYADYYGNADKQFNIGVSLYESGDWTGAVYAVRWFRRSAQQGNADAQKYLGGMYEHGRGVQPDDVRSVYWYRKSGYTASNGRGVEQFLRSAERGNTTAKECLGEMFSECGGEPPHDSIADRWYRWFAEQGDPAAQYRVGSMYDEGKGVDQDDEEAVRWYRKSADQGNADAQLNLDLIEGCDVTHDLKSDLRSFLVMPEQCHPIVQRLVGFMYSAGRGVFRAPVEAAKWYHGAARQGAPVAQRLLGHMYDDGFGVQSSTQDAFTWYRRAAEQGDAEAQWCLGRMYADGRGVRQDNEAAVSWYKKSAEQGSEVAQMHLDWIYENVEREIEEVNQRVADAKCRLSRADTELMLRRHQIASSEEDLDHKRKLLDQLRNAWATGPRVEETDLANAREEHNQHMTKAQYGRSELERQRETLADRHRGLSSIDAMLTSLETAIESLKAGASDATCLQDSDFMLQLDDDTHRFYGDSIDYSLRNERRTRAVARQVTEAIQITGQPPRSGNPRQQRQDAKFALINDVVDKLCELDRLLQRLVKHDD